MNIQKLKGKLAECDITISAMADMLGISYTAMHNKMHGRSQFTQGEMRTIAERLKLTNDEIMNIFFTDEGS